MVIDTATNSVTSTISLGSYFPVAVAVDPQTDTIYADGWDSQDALSAIFVIDGTTDTVTTTLSEKSNIRPQGLAVDPATDTIYVANYPATFPDQSIAVLDGTTNQITGSISIAAYLYGLAVDPATDTIYAIGGNASNGTPGLWAIDGQTQAITGPVDLSTFRLFAAPYGVAVNAATNTVYVAVGYGVQVIDGATDTITATIDVPASEGAVAVGVDQSTGLVYAMGKAATNVIDGASDTVIASFPRGGYSAAADPAVSTVYIADGFSLGDVWVVTPSTTTAYSPILTGGTTASFTVGASGSYSLPVSASPAATFSETGALPPGLSLSPGGVLAGTPAPDSGGLHQIQVTAANGTGSATQAFTLTVDQKPAFTSPARAVFTAGVKGRFTITTTGFPAATLTKTGRLPKGLTFTARPHGTATITGTPARSAQGRYVITITAKNSAGQTTTQTLVIRVR